MNDRSVLPPDHRYYSYFMNTQRNIIMYCLTHLVILPVYLTCVVVATQDIQLPLLQTVLRGLALLPLINALFAPIYLSPGIKGHETVMIVSIMIGVTLIYRTYLHLSFDPLVVTNLSTFNIPFGPAYFAPTRNMLAEPVLQRGFC
jgi:hypothetical protein